MKGNKRNMKSKRRIVAMIMVATLICMYTIPSFADSEADSQTEPVAENAPMVQAVVQGTFNGSPAELDENGNLLINEANFPDLDFRTLVGLIYDDGNGKLDTGEVARVTAMDLWLLGLSCTSLKGIEYFTALEELGFSGLSITELDLSKNTALKKLDCQYTPLRSLDVSGLTELEDLHIIYSQITELDVSKNAKLEVLWCFDNQMTELDVSKNTALGELQCQDNQLDRLDLGGITGLKILACGNNQLKSLDVSKNTDIVDLSCHNNQLIELDISQNTSIEALVCYTNQLTKLDIGKLTGLEILVCSDNQLSSLDLTKSTGLESLICSKNQLRSLDVSKNTALTQLFCHRNQIIKLNLSKNTSLSSGIGISDQSNEGVYKAVGNKYTVDLSQFNGVDPDKVTVTDGGIKNGNIVTYDTEPTTMTYSYGTDNNAMSYMDNVVISLTEEITPPVTPVIPDPPVTPITPSTPDTGNGGNGGTTALVARVISTETVAPITGSVAQPEETAKVEAKTVTNTPSKPDYGQEEGNWSLLSLILALGAILMGIGMLIRKSDDEKYRTNISKAGAVVIPVIGAVLFFILNNVASPMVLITPTTAIFAVVAVLQLVNMLTGKAKYQYKEEQQ